MTCRRQDAVLLVFLSMLGFDVLIFSPGASLSIEHYITGQLLNTYRLEKISFDETLAHLSSVRVKALSSDTQNRFMIDDETVFEKNEVSI